MARRPDWESGNARPVIEFLLYRREAPTLNLALARFGSHIPVLRKIYNLDEKVLQLAVLANPNINPWSLFRDKGPVSENHILDLLRNLPASRDHLEAYFSNANISRDLLEKIFDPDSDKESKFSFVSDDTKLFIVRLITKNKIITKKYDDTYLDGFGEYMHNRLPLAL